jgi:hypothetical protein
MGTVPGEVDFGQRIDRAIDYILFCQKANGLVTFPPVVEMLSGETIVSRFLAPESHHNDAHFGNAYSTALVLLTLGADSDLPALRWQQ